MALISSLDPVTPSYDIGLPFKEGGEVSYAVPTGAINLPKTAYLIHVGNGGDLIVEGIDGKPIPFYGLLDGDWIPVVTNKILQNAIINGTSRITTASQITWYGGQ